MGTNFYVNGRHIGKRSAAGPYCYDCRVSLAKDERGPHYSGEMFSACPKCGNKPDKNTDAAMRELGFFKGSLNKKGVTSCSSFSWAMHPYEIPEGVITSEYGEVIKDFKKEVADDCALHYFHHIGSEFS